LRCPDDDIYEEKDSKATATPMNNGAGINAIVCKGDPDRFQIVVPRAGWRARFTCASTRCSSMATSTSRCLTRPTDNDTNPVATSTSVTNDETINFVDDQPRAAQFQVKVIGFTKLMVSSLVTLVGCGHGVGVVVGGLVKQRDVDVAIDEHRVLRARESCTPPRSGDHDLEPIGVAFAHDRVDAGAVVHRRGRGL